MSKQQLKELEIQYNTLHERYKKGEITFQELEPLITKYREAYDKYLKQTGDIDF